MLNIRDLFRNYKETGSLAEQCSIFGFIDDSCFLTKSGAVGVVLQLQGVDYECLSQQDIDISTKRLEAAFKLFGPDFRIYQYLFKNQFEPELPPDYKNQIVHRAEQERYAYLVGKSTDLYSIQTYYVLLYQGPTSPAKMSWLKTLSSFATDGLDAGMQNVAARYRSKEQVAFIENELDRALVVLHRQAYAFASHLADFCQIEILGKNDAFKMLRRLLNFDPEKLRYDQLKYDVFTDKYLVGSTVESNPDHLVIDGYYTRVLTLSEEPAQSWPLILQELYQIQATYHVSTEWHAVEGPEALDYIKGMRTHFHKTKAGISTTNTGDRLQDETKAEFVDDLNECLKEIQKHGNYFGKFTLTIVIYGRDRAQVDKAVSDFNKVLSNKSAKVFIETYNQLAAFFATLPGNTHFNYRQLYITNNNYADWSFVFSLHEGYRRNNYLNREALCLLETEYGTPFHLNFHQRINDGPETDEVGHALILGRTGSGKSFLSNFFVLSFQKYDPYTFIFDVGGSYKNLTRLLNGSYLKVGAARASYTINPFSLPPTEENVEFLSSFIHVLLAGNDNYRTTNDEDKEIYRAIGDMYQIEPEIRRLQTYARTLPRILGKRLDKWVEGGQYGYAFDNIEDTITLAQFQCFDFQGMDDYPQLVQALLFYVLHRTSAVIYDPAKRGTLKIFWLDEAWKFFTVPVIREYLIKAALTWRKHNAILVLTTQSPDHLRQSNLLGLLDSLPTKLFLANPGADFKFYSEAFHLNPREIELIQTLTQKKEFFLKADTMGKKLSLMVDNKSYWLYTSSPQDNERLEALIKEHGFDKALELLSTRR